jgi:hypothetical protein
MKQEPTEHIRVCVAAEPEENLVYFLKTVWGRLSLHQTVGEVLTHEQLAELAAKFNLTDGDWAWLYRTICESK